MNKRVFLLVLFLTAQAVTFAQFEDLFKDQDLLRSPAISVTVGGSFIVTGTFPGYVNERLDQFVTRVYTEARRSVLQVPTEPEILDELRQEVDNVPLRGITLKRFDGTELEIDLLKYRITGNFEHNPKLQNDDVIIFPPLDLKRNFFTIEGAVNEPGTYQFVEGDRLDDALLLARGINQAYEDISGVEISRLSYNGEQMQILTFGLNENPELKRGDRLRVAADETQRKDFRVLVLGEVVNPGDIPITKGSTTLSRVIDVAGGFSEFAGITNVRIFDEDLFPPNYLSREFNIEYDRQYLEREPQIISTLTSLESSLFSRMSNLTEADTAYFELETQLNVLLNSQTVNLSERDENGNLKRDPILNDGDIIIVPKKETSVYVLGQVRYPGGVHYKEGEDMWYYVKRAGGMGELAEIDDIMIIKAVTKEWVETDPDEPMIMQRGDYIWIPRDIQHSFNYYVQQVGGYLGIVGSAATIILLLIQFGK